MIGKLKKIQGKNIVVELEENADVLKIGKYVQNKAPYVDLRVNDNRTITIQQRAKFFALINDLCQYTGDVPEYWKDFFKMQVKETFDLQELSLSDCSVTDGNRLILAVLNFLFEWDIPFKTKTWDSLPDEFPKQMLCLKNKRCVLCGKPADIAHFRAVGAGRNRNKISHVGNYIMMLCRSHHIEQHKIGVKSFINLYHIKPIKVTPEIAKRLKLGKVEEDERRI